MLQPKRKLFAMLKSKLAISDDLSKRIIEVIILKKQDLNAEDSNKKKRWDFHLFF